MDQNQLSPRGAVLMGLAFLAAGVMPILISLGVVPGALTEGTPAWVGMCAGLMFVACGLAVMLDYGLAGVGPDGDLKPGTPFAIRLANLTIGLTIVGLMTAISGWVAFGPGPRAFSSSLSLPFYAKRWEGGELTGRIAFGAGTIFMVFMFVACGFTGMKRLITSLRGSASPGTIRSRTDP